MALLTRRAEPGPVTRQLDIPGGVELRHRVLAGIGDPHHREGRADRIELQLVAIGRAVVDARQHAEREVGIGGVGLRSR